MPDNNQRPDSGREILRGHVYSWSRSPGGGLARLADAAGIGLGALDDFGSGRSLTLSPECLDRLAACLLNARWLPDRDLLESRNQQPSIPLPEPRPAFVPTSEIGRAMVALHAKGRAERLKNELSRPPAPRPQPKPRRAGWVE
jgi:hypothetical protein